MVQIPRPEALPASGSTKTAGVAVGRRDHSGAASNRMLQTNLLNAEKSRSPQTGPASSDDAGSGGVAALIDLALGLLRRQYLVIILTAVFALASCIIYLRITPPTYTGRVQVLLANPRGTQFV